MDEYEVQIILTDSNNDSVSITIPNGITTLTAESEEVTNVKETILNNPILRINTNGDENSPEKVQMYLIRKVKTDLGEYPVA